MANGLVQIQGITGEGSAMMAPIPSPQVFEGESLLCGLDVGSTTCKYVLATPRGNVLAQAYERHNTRQAEKILQFLTMLESKHGFTAGRGEAAPGFRRRRRLDGGIAEEAWRPRIKSSWTPTSRWIISPIASFDSGITTRPKIHVVRAT